MTNLTSGILTGALLLLATACSNEPLLSDQSSPGWLAGMQAPCRPLNETDLDDLIERERSAVEAQVRHYIRAIEVYEELPGQWRYEGDTYFPGPDSSDAGEANTTIPDDPLPAAKAAEEYTELAYAMTPDCEFLEPPLERGGFYWTSGFNDSDYRAGRVHIAHILRIWQAANEVEGLALGAEGRADATARLVQRHEAMLELGSMAGRR